MLDSEIQNLVTKTIQDGFVFDRIEWPNVRLDSQNLDEWVRVSFKPYSASRTNFKDGHRKRGAVYIQAFTRQDIGANRAFQLAEQAAATLTFKILNGVVFGPNEMTLVGKAVSASIATTETQWFQVNASVDYTVIV